MRTLKVIWIIPFIVWCNIVYAEISPMQKPGKVGDLGLVIVASETPAYIKEWLNTPAEHGVTIKRLRVAKPDQLIVVAFLISGVAPDANSNYEFSVNVFFLNPKGKPIFGERNYSKGKGKIHSKPAYIMADPALDIVLESSDPTGVYTIVAQVTDIVTGKKAESSYKIKFIK